MTVTMHHSSGFALLEALLALMILSTAGLSFVAAVDSRVRLAAEAESRERAIVDAGRVLTAMTLLKREDLDQRLGRREVGEFVVEVERPERTLYRIAIRESAAMAVEQLVTVVYRP